MRLEQGFGLRACIVLVGGNGPVQGEALRAQCEDSITCFALSISANKVLVPAGACSR